MSTNKAHAAIIHWIRFPAITTTEQMPLADARDQPT